MHGDILRIAIVFGDNAEVLIIFDVEPKDGAALAVHLSDPWF